MRKWKLFTVTKRVEGTCFSSLFFLFNYWTAMVLHSQHFSIVIAYLQTYFFNSSSNTHFSLPVYFFLTSLIVDGFVIYCFSRRQLIPRVTSRWTEHCHFPGARSSTPPENTFLTTRFYSKNLLTFPLWWHAINEPAISNPKYDNLTRQWKGLKKLLKAGDQIKQKRICNPRQIKSTQQSP